MILEISAVLLWEKERSVIENWSMANSSFDTLRNYILKYGMNTCWWYCKLPAETRCNQQPHRGREQTLRKKNHSGGSTTVPIPAKMQRNTHTNATQTDHVLNINKADINFLIDDDATIPLGGLYQFIKKRDIDIDITAGKTLNSTEDIP